MNDCEHEALCPCACKNCPGFREGFIEMINDSCKVEAVESWEPCECECHEEPQEPQESQE
jgi:hypothetical protein